MDEKRLLLQYRNTKDKKILDYFIIRYTKYVKTIASRIYKAIYPHSLFDYNDIFQLGLLGLWDAIEKYKPLEDKKFLSYANYRIQGYIYDELRRTDWLPRSIRAIKLRLVNISNRLFIKLGRNPTADELAKELNITEKKLNQAINTDTDSFTSIDLFTSYKRNSFIKDTIEGSKSDNPALLLERKEDLKLLYKGLDNLPNEKKEIVRLYFFENWTMSKIAEQFDCTETLISMAVKEIKKYLIDYFENKGIKINIDNMYRYIDLGDKKK